jgi:hypothetical protein
MNHDHTVASEDCSSAPAGAAAASHELLIADPRGSLTPGQMVDQKLQALLGSGSRSLYSARTTAMDRGET